MNGCKLQRKKYDGNVYGIVYGHQNKGAIVLRKPHNGSLLSCRSLVIVRMDRLDRAVLCDVEFRELDGSLV